MEAEEEMRARDSVCRSSFYFIYICAHKRNRESSRDYLICPDKKGVGLKPHEERTEAYREEGTMLDRRIVLTMKKIMFQHAFWL